MREGRVLIERPSIKTIRKRLPDSLRYGAQAVLGWLPFEIHHGGEYRRWRAYLDESQYWTMARHRETQAKHLSDLLVHCFRNVPYYREMALSHGLRAENFRNVEDL